ncbi:helix-turn-helix domain-containing protein [Streptomyces sp. NPDC056987]|uniref:helix-turn-helix domain-containing protein n=1 Tax=Streptomyces sp. NPDC056987 TaxID=3345988 RepID=UPI0036273983
MTSHAPNRARVVPLRPRTAEAAHESGQQPGKQSGQQPKEQPREPLWRHLVGDVLRRERLAQERTLKDVAEAARISMPYLSELERGRKEASSEVLAAAAGALGLGLADLLALSHGELVRLDRARTRQDRRPAKATGDGTVTALAGRSRQGRQGTWSRPGDVRLAA